METLDKAIWRRGRMRAAGAIHHSDQGSQYTSFAFTHRLAREGLLGSMGTIGDALDNAMCESLIGTIKIGELGRQPWRSIEDIRATILEWIEPGTTAAAGAPASATSHPWSTKTSTTTDIRSPTPNLSWETVEAQAPVAVETLPATDEHRAFYCRPRSESRNVVLV